MAGQATWWWVGIRGGSNPTEQRQVEEQRKQESKNEQRSKETSVVEANKTKVKQRGEEIEVEKANKLYELSKSNDELDESSEFNRSDCLFVSTV